MAFRDRLFGRKTFSADRTGPGTANEIDVGRYTRLLRDATPEGVEQLHLEAFGQLAPAQLRIVFDQLFKNATTADERPLDASPASLARAAALAERRRPGTLARILDTGHNEPRHETPVLGIVVGHIIATEVVSPSFWNDAGAASYGAGPTDSSGGVDAVA